MTFQAFIQIFIKISPLTNVLEWFWHKSGLIWPWMTFEVILHYEIFVLTFLKVFKILGVDQYHLILQIYILLLKLAPATFVLIKRDIFLYFKLFLYFRFFNELLILICIQGQRDKDCYEIKWASRTKKRRLSYEQK